MLLRQLSTFLADASLALDASGSLAEMLQLVAEHARELTGAERSAVSLTLSDETWRVEAPVLEQRETALDSRLDELASLYHALRSPGGRLRMTGTDLQRHLDPETLAGAADATWKPRGWLVAPLTALDGRDLGLIQAFDKHAGEFSELDEATLVQLAQMASAAVERAELYRQVR
jgi:GAF domain-containing protein